jgi:hypothetical protein
MRTSAGIAVVLPFGAAVGLVGTAAAIQRTQRRKSLEPSQTKSGGSSAKQSSNVSQGKDQHQGCPCHAWHHENATQN